MMVRDHPATAVQPAALKLLEYCRSRDWAGYDPYDALNSKLFEALPPLNFKWSRLCLTQALKRLPLNLRPLLMVPRKQNPKGLALFLSAAVNLLKLGLVERDLVIQLAERLAASRSPGKSHWCWGYSFPWQTRTVLVPRGSPNIVCTTFAANALLDVFSITQDSRYRAMALSAADFIVDDLFWSEGESVASFSYPLSGVRTRVHNANFLGAALLCRAFACSEQDKYLVPALKVTRYSAGRQRSDGSWDYGESSTQGWVDHFHTGFNLCALRDVARASGTGEFDRAIERGFDFYRQNFFTEDAAPKYFHNQAYPYDIHSAAQAMLTLIDFKDFNAENVSMANAVCQWTLNNLHDPEGYFHFQKHRYYTNKIPYMRWSQAWMLLALSVMLLEELP